MNLIKIVITLCCLVCNIGFSQVPKSEFGPVFEDMGPTYNIANEGLPLDSSMVLKAVFDIDYQSKDSLASNALISSLHRFLNMHVKSGIKPSNISLAFVLHGASTKDALSDEAYLKKYGRKNPNTQLIKTLHEQGVDMFICGQSASYQGISKASMLPEIKVALSAMTVLTIYQSKGYSLIKF